MLLVIIRIAIVIVVSDVSEISGSLARRRLNIAVGISVLDVILIKFLSGGVVGSRIL